MKIVKAKAKIPKKHKEKMIFKEIKNIIELLSQVDNISKHVYDEIFVDNNIQTLDELYDHCQTCVDGFKKLCKTSCYSGLKIKYRQFIGYYTWIIVQIEGFRKFI